MNSSSPTANDQTPMGWGSASFALLTVFLWGGTAVSNHFAMDLYPPLFVGAVRFGLAAIFMAGWCIVERSPLLLRQGQWKAAAILGFLLLVQIGLFNLGTFHTSASHASILVNSYVFWVAAFESLIFRVVILRPSQLMGLVLAAVGCSCLFLGAQQHASGSELDQPTLFGDGILLLSGFSLSIKILYTKKFVQHIPPGTLILWHDVIGALLLWGVSLLTETVHYQPPDWKATFALAYGGLIISGFCFGANAWLLRRHGASQVAVFSFLTPLFGVLLGILLRGDGVSMWLLIAGLLVTTGIYFVNTPSRSRAQDV